jgi:hypothetical protein
MSACYWKAIPEITPSSEMHAKILIFLISGLRLTVLIALVGLDRLKSISFVLETGDLFASNLHIGRGDVGLSGC